MPQFELAIDVSRDAMFAYLAARGLKKRKDTNDANLTKAFLAQFQPACERLSELAPKLDAVTVQDVVLDAAPGADLEALAADLVGADEDETPARRSIVPDSYKKLYGKAAHCGDELAVVLKEHLTTDKGHLDIAELERVMVQNGIAPDRWGHLNAGQRRMNLGNVLRHRVENGDRVVIGGAVFNDDALGDDEEEVA